MGKVKNNLSAHQKTQPIESLPSSPPASGEDKDHCFGNSGDEFMHNTILFEDDDWINDEYLETPVIDIKFDDDDFLLCDETQALNFAFESHEESLVEVTQLLEASDGLTTQLLDHFDGEVSAGNSELSGRDDSLSKGGNLLSNEDNRQDFNEKIKSADALDNGKMARFTSVRSAAFRRSAMAARVPTQTTSNNDCSNLVNCHSSGQGAIHTSNFEYNVREVGNRQSPPNASVETKNDFRKVKKTARKLIFEDSPEKKCPSVDLSYIDSQEPCEASHASALKLVDKLISEFCLDLEVEADCGRRRTEEKSNPVASLKGPHELAKKLSYKSRAVGNSIFDWDDSREDEGGGDIFRRRKEEFFGFSSKSQKSSALPTEQKRGLGVAVDKRKAHSDSRLLQHGLTRSQTKIQAAKRNLGKELDEMLGNDTEAIGALCSGDGSGKFDAEVGKKLSPEEERGISNRGVITRSNGTKRIHAMSKDELFKRRMKKASPISTKGCGKNIQRSVKNDQFDKEEIEAGPDAQMATETTNALHSGDGKETDPEPNCLVSKKLLSEKGGVSSHGVVTRQSKRMRGIQAEDNDIESLKPKSKKAKSILAKACDKNMDMSKLLKQSSGGEARISKDPAFDTPSKSKTYSKKVSPICIGDKYHKLSCKDSFKSNTTRELRSLTSPLAKPILDAKSTRKRRDLSTIHVLFSQHLDEDVIKHQKKILAKFGIPEASSMMEATHFIADNFMPTRNMLEAIALGKPVVTTQWLESINQVNIYVDDDRYILKGSTKEKDFGSNMRAYLASARLHPLLQGRKVLITPNTKPCLKIIMTLVKAVHGLPVQRLGRSALSKDKIPENLLILSCEEDRDISIPLLERGANVYSSELLLNGIITQKLDYERYQLFTDHVRKTRSTVWIKEGKGEFQRRRG